MTARAIWEERYRKGETGWDRGASSPVARTWVEHLGLTPCRLLIPGCGFGHEVVEFARHGFDVTAVDIAPSAIHRVATELRNNNLTAQTICTDLFDFDPETPFDAIYEQTCMCAIQPERRPEYARRLRRWLIPGGRLLAMFMQTGAEGGPPWHCGLLDMHRLFPDKPWHWQETPPTLIPHRNGLFELAFQLERK